MHKIYTTAQTTWESQLSDILNATTSIYYEQYIIESFGNDEIGTKFIEALIKKAKEGLEVRLILDFQGSVNLFMDLELESKLKDAGLLITYYKTLPASRAFSPIRLMLRDHRKILLIDHTITWIGGVVIGEGFRDWDDLMVRFDDLRIADYCNREFRRQTIRIENGKIILAPLDVIDHETTLVGNSPGLGNRFCYEKISHQMLTSDKVITIVTPYFAPPLRLQRVISRKLSEGVTIKVIIPKSSDKNVADWAREVFFSKMVKKGMIVKYLPKMNHAKIVMVDENWCTFGSTNIDTLSLVMNHELNLISINKDLVRDIRDVIDGWESESTEATYQTLLFNDLNFFQKVVGRLARYFV